MFGLFNGVVRPYTQLPVFWRYWMYWVNPATYWIGGILAATLDGIPVQCDVAETAQFDAPPGQTCQEYAGGFANSSGGYLLNPDATSGCQYCPYQSGNQYLTTLNISASQKWRSKSFSYLFHWLVTNQLETDFGIFLAFCISNWALVYFFIYTVRIKGWSFGFGKLFGGLEKALNMVKKRFKGNDEKSG
jgi:ABC-type multidrug transport system permease subunit